MSTHSYFYLTLALSGIFGLSACNNHNSAPQQINASKLAAIDAKQSHDGPTSHTAEAPINRREILETVWSMPRPANAYQVPKITHHIWLTSKDTPNEISDADIDAIQTSILMTPPEEGWRHYFWCNDPARIPQTIAKLVPYGVEVKVASNETLPNLNNFWQDAVANAASVAKSMPAHILRYLVLDNFGGVYMDTNYELVTSIDDIAEGYSLFASEEPDSSMMGASILASAPHHPVMREAVDLLEKNITHPSRALTKLCDRQTYNKRASGAELFTEAFSKKANSDVHYRDTFFPDDKQSSVQNYAFVPTIWSQQIGIRHYNPQKQDSKSSMDKVTCAINHARKSVAQLLGGTTK